MHITEEQLSGLLLSDSKVYKECIARNIRETRPHTSAPAKERYTGTCAIQDNCTDYADFIESMEDELSEDDDPVCPIKCAKRVNPQQESLDEAARAATLADRKAIRDYITEKTEGCECPFDDEMNDTPCSLAKSCAQCIFDHAVESLRVGETP
jgi:hypothetical protein